MSSIWSPAEPGEATVLAGWGDFGSVGRRAGFRTRFGAVGEGAGWVAAGADVPDDLPPEPEIDLVEQASREGFVAGYQEGERLTREAMSADDAARRELAAAVAEIAGAGEGALASLIAQAVLRLVGQIVGEVAIDEDRLADRCAAVAACIDPDDARAVLEVHPEDLALIDRDDLGVTLAPSLGMTRGSVRLATRDGWIEDGPDVRLDRLKALMDDMEGRL